MGLMTANGLSIRKVTELINTKISQYGLSIDSNSDGKVNAADNSDKLGNQSPDYYKGKIDLLWQNASPGSTFGAQTVSLSLSAYDMVAIIVIPDNTYSTAIYGPAQLVKIGQQCETFTSTSKGTTTIGRRHVSVTTSGITFANGRYWSFDTNLTNNANTNVPRYIYGIKF